MIYVKYLNKLILKKLTEARQPQVSLNKINYKFMKVRFLKKKDLEKFQKMVNNYYKKNHILAKSKKIINFYYNFSNKKNLFIIGLFDKDDSLLSAMGLIPYKNWDEKLNNDYHIAFWVKKDKLINSLWLFKFIFNNIKPNFLATSGINLKTSGRIFQRFGKIKFFDNHYIKNLKSKNSFFQKLSNKTSKYFAYNQLTMTSKDCIDKLPPYLYRPKKTIKYFKNKYFKNPFYDYFCLNFYYKKKLQFFFICRELKIKKYKVSLVRVVDFYGVINQRHNISFLLQEFLYKNNYEYIDFVSVGLRRDLESLGFLRKKNKDFLPELFEPYDHREGSRNYCILINKYKSNIVLVKADGDGDRPNLI